MNNSLLKQIFEEVITYGNDYFDMNHKLEMEITNIFDSHIEKMELTKKEKETLENVFFDVSAAAQYTGFQQGIKLTFRLLSELLSE